MTGEDAFPLKHAVRARSRDLIAASARLAKASDVAFLLTPTPLCQNSCRLDRS